MGYKGYRQHFSELHQQELKKALLPFGLVYNKRILRNKSNSIFLSFLVLILLCWRYPIMHELTHLKNKDIFINWIITFLSMIYWFNPILLYGFHKMRQDCEFSCDGIAISYLDEGENLQYGNAIIKVHRDILLQIKCIFRIIII